MIVALAVLPSEKSTVVLPFAAPASTTWLLVRMKPSLRITNPEPVPTATGPLTLIVTTAGRLLAATSAMEPFGRAIEPAGAGGNGAAAPSLRPTRNAPAIPPNTAATIAIARAPATMAKTAPAPRPCRPLCSEELVITGEAPSKEGPTGGELWCTTGLPPGGG